MKRLRRFATPDTLAVLLLLALWWLFFWRLFTPSSADRVMLVPGDFSGQFVAFGGYQYTRVASGAVPLWNPYNNGGLPFIADTQAAVFYPPRLLTIGLSAVGGGWTYNALQMEMTVHVLAFSLLMYLFVRRLTTGYSTDPHASVFGAFVAAVIAGYGGWTSGYPPLQLAVLEAGIWLPLAVLGLLEASRTGRLRWDGLLLTGFALGMSWLAGHPQTSFFLTYLLVAYWGWRVYQRRWSVRVFVGGAALFGLLAVGLAAVQLLPGAEYLLRTTRAGLGFDAKGNGFPFQDVLQLIFPAVVSLWSPLYVGLAGVVFALLALSRRLPDSLFWGMVALLALLLSFGANSPVFHALYNLLPGLSFFRGQERAAYLVSSSLTILAGIGAAHLLTLNAVRDAALLRGLRRGLLALALLTGGVLLLVFVGWLGSGEAFGEISRIALTTLTAGGLLAVIWFTLQDVRKLRLLALVGSILVFDLFSISMDSSNYMPLPAQDPLSAPALLAPILNDGDGVYRVDGFRGLTDNYGSLYGVMDLRGISPLFLDSAHEIIARDYINPRAWEVFAVRYVYTDWAELPVPWEIVGSGTDRWGGVNLHRLLDARPFAHLVYNFEVIPDDAAARERLFATDFAPRYSVILAADPGIAPQTAIPDDARALITTFEPEHFAVQVFTPAPAILSLAQVDYPGWQAYLDGQPVSSLRAYGALMAVVIPAGEHTVEARYEPLSYRLGAVLSLFTGSIIVILVLILTVSFGRNYANSNR